MGATVARAGKRLAIAVALAAAMAGFFFAGTKGGLTGAAAGFQLYDQGRNAAGEPVPAIVQGDIEADSLQLTCTSCHGRSGLGSIEGGRLVPPVRWQYLMERGTNYGGHRPRYDREGVLRAIREGVGPAGKPLDGLMPRYRLSDEEGEQLLAYLESLTAEMSPGVTPTTLELATVIAPDAEPAQARAMLDVLERYIADKNAQSRGESRRRAVDRKELRVMYKGYRDWKLNVWRLEGRPESWGRQLAANYAAQPVFALLSGIGRDWRPVHEFCEKERVPCLLPNTDLPVVDQKNEWTVYFSEGLHLEAEIIAAQFGASAAPRILQVLRAGEPAEQAAAGLDRAAALHGWPAPATERLAAVDRPDAAWLSRRAEAAKADAVVLWLGPDDLARFDGAKLAARVFVSGSSLGPHGAAPRLAAREASLVQPFAVGAVHDERFRRTELWIKAKGIAPGDQRIQDQTLFACMLLGENLRHLLDHFYRDYLLEKFDHDSSNVGYTAFYPRLTFGPGQRYLSKGAWVVPLSGSAKEKWALPGM